MTMLAPMNFQSVLRLALGFHAMQGAKEESLPQEDPSVSSSHAALVMESMRLEDPALRPDTKSTQWSLPESFNMPEPLHDRRRSINQRMSLSLRRLEVHTASEVCLANPPITIMGNAWKTSYCDATAPGKDGWRADL